MSSNTSMRVITDQCPECRQKWEAEHAGQAALGAARKDVD